MLFELNYTTFYLLINILDIFTFTSLLGVFFKLSSIPALQVTVSTGLFFSILALVISTVSLAMFIVHKHTFSPILHQFYNWTRALSFIFFIFIGAYLVFFVSFFRENKIVFELTLKKIGIIVGLLAGLAYMAFNIGWSITLKKMLVENENEIEMKNNGIESGVESNDEIN